MQFLMMTLLFLAGCAHSRLSVDSLPTGADVTAIDEDGKIRPLGKTPLNLEYDDVFRSGAVYSRLELSKEDHQTESLLISKAIMPVNYDLSVALKKQHQDVKAAEANNRNERIAQSIAQANNLINQKRLLEAEQLMVKFVQDYPHISVGYDYMGNINYLKKDLKRALYFYQKGLHINPENIETREMVNKLNTILN